METIFKTDLLTGSATGEKNVYYLGGEVSQQRLGPWFSGRRFGDPVVTFDKLLV